jgi:peptidoglycan hydrolase-like protein with peptidoglycan-binding domain
MVGLKKGGEAQAGLGRSRGRSAGARSGGWRRSAVTISKSRIIGGSSTAIAGGSVNITLPQLKAGDRDKPQDRMVHRLQGLVTALGNPITIDGIFGPNTEAAVKAQQHAFGLSQTGVVDDNTWTKLIGG